VKWITAQQELEKMLKRQRKILAALEKKLADVSEMGGPPFLWYVSVSPCLLLTPRCRLNKQEVTDATFPRVCEVLKLPNCSATTLE
jgi:hypothetical protein